MRHENLMRRDRFDALDAAALWPVGLPLAPAPVTEIIEPFAPTPAAPDVPAAVGRMIAASYAALIASLFFATAGTAYSIFMIAISAAFVAIFFTVPFAFLKVEPMRDRRISLNAFMRNGMETLTGHSSAKAALVQMMIVPVFLTLGIGAMGIAASIIL